MKIKGNDLYHQRILSCYVEIFSSNNIFCLFGRYMIPPLKDSPMFTCKKYKYVIVLSCSLNLKILLFKNIAIELNELKKSLFNSLCYLFDLWFCVSCLSYKFPLSVERNCFIDSMHGTIFFSLWKKIKWFYSLKWEKCNTTAVSLVLLQKFAWDCS